MCEFLQLDCIGVIETIADMTSTTMATWLPAIWSMKPTITYRSNVVYVPLLDHTWEGEIRAMGNTVNIPGFSQNNAPNNRGAGTGTFGTASTLTMDAVTESQTQLVVNRFYYKAFRQPVELTQQQMPGYVPLLIQGHGVAISVQIDADIAGDNTNGVDAFSTTVGTDNVDLTEDDILTVDTNLNNQNAPITERYAVMSPASMNSLRKIERVTSQLYSSTMGSLSADKGAGYVGKYSTFDFYMSNNNEAGTAGKKNGMFQREAIAYADQMNLQTIKNFQLEAGGFDQYLTFQTCGFKIVKNAFGNEVDGK